MNSPTTATPPRKRTLTYNQLTSCPDMEPEFVAIYEPLRRLTITSLERMYGLYKAVEYIVQHRLPGDIVECGIWKGGSAMLCAQALQQFGDTTRTLWLYDTFEGMTEPTAADVDYDGATADDIMVTHGITDLTEWCASPLAEVQSHMQTTGYPSDRVRYVEGRVEHTIPGQAPDTIALLRLDTDWHASTQHEMEHLYPRLITGGVLIIDDYGHWQGARRAVDDYFNQHQISMLLNRLDYTGRIGIKP